MASCPDLKVTITVDVVERGRATYAGKWRGLLECRKCGHIDCVFCNSTLHVCEKCGNRGELYAVVARWVTRRTGFWPWQRTSSFEKKAA